MSLLSDLKTVAPLTGGCWDRQSGCRLWRSLLFCLYATLDEPVATEPSLSVEQTAITGSAGLPSVQLNDGLGDVLSDESSSGWNSTSSPGEFGNDEDFVHDEVVREWTSSASTMDADSYLTSPMRRNMTEEELI
ncbi:hypothetical protein MHU86_23298 [Fragilaria crotonensis]|nr:hypothetical protein MHU86_23298 [Fragilaria crotonensis]